MNKGQLVEAIARDAKLTKTDANKSVNAIIKAATTTLKKGGKLVLVGFGTFSMSKRSARKGRNPQTGKEIRIPAKNVAKFKAGIDLAKAVNK